MVMYELRSWKQSAPIVSVHVDRATPLHVWVDGVCRSRRSLSIYDTWEQAHARLVELLQKRVKEISLDLGEEEAYLNEVKLMTPPKEVAQ